jgi:Flp pilus assembly pilin Flp
MRQLLACLWADDRGALLSIEFLLVSTILVLGLVVGLAALRNALATELTALANAILTLNSGSSGGSSGTSGATQLMDPVQTPPTSVSVIDATPTCN